MTNEEFQRIVLEELRGLKEDVGGLKEDVGGLKEDVGFLKAEQKKLAEKVNTLEIGQTQLAEKIDKMDRKIDVVYDQTACLTEFKEEADKNIIKAQEDNKRLKEIVGRHEIEIKSLQEKIG